VAAETSLPAEPAEPAVRAAIAAHRGDFDKPGVLSVRPGWEFTRGWLTGRRAIVATVDKKRADVGPGDRLPDEVAGVPVDVRQASPRKKQELLHPQKYGSELRLSPDLGSVPHFADETSPAGAPAAVGASAHDALVAQAAKAVKQHLDYSPPANTPLAPVTGPATIHLAASPDAGWSLLQPFLAGTQATLTVGLYDFTSQHVLNAVTAALAGKTLKLTLDHPATNPTADQTDAETVTALQGALAGNFEQAWALSRTDPDATAWIFATAYHIKVAVADSDRFWLSSGNWNNSNQPAIDPVTAGTGSPDAATARHSDRDWHVIAEQSDLAAVFEAYLLNDLAIAAANNGPPEVPGPQPPAPGTGSTQTPAFEEFFGPVSITDTMTLTPLLTPDPGDYASAIKALIESAQTKLYLQFQYIEPPRTADATSQPFVDLINAVIGRQQAGVDVRIIASEYQTAGYLEQLQTLGLDVASSVKIQNNVHNKGIIVDTQQVLVSSQNWSTDGTLYNRDAGLIIGHPDAAAYFEKIFLHDWNHLSHQKAAED
jgi:hypothetical protein